MNLFEQEIVSKPMRDHQEKFIHDVREAAKHGHKRIMGCASVGWGKCHGAGTKVIMYDGTVRSIEDVAPGDALMGPDSQPRYVFNTVHGYGPLYLIEPIKGEPFTCNDVHILSLKETRWNSVK